jgi:hypothetical protein
VIWAHLLHEALAALARRDASPPSERFLVLSLPPSTEESEPTRKLAKNLAALYVGAEEAIAWVGAAEPVGPPPGARYWPQVLRDAQVRARASSFCLYHP